MYLNRCFQTGEQPVPGPLIGGEIILILNKIWNRTQN